MSYSLRVLFGAKSPVGLFYCSSFAFLLDLENAYVWSYYFLLQKETLFAQTAFALWSYFFLMSRPGSISWWSRFSQSGRKIGECYRLDQEMSIAG
jgi:hypothetical protein